jgi:hypothetical protein
LNLTKAIKRINNEEEIINLEKYIAYIPGKKFCDIIDLNENEIFVLMSYDSNSNIDLTTIDFEYNLIKQIAIPPADNVVSIKSSLLGKISKKNSLELIYLFTSYELEPDEEIYIARVFNQNLDFLFEKEIKFNRYSVTIFNNNIFCLFDSNLDYSKLYVYDENLNEIERYGQPDENLPFYFSENISQLFLNENYYIIKEGKNIIIMDRKNGFRLKTFSNGIESYYIDIYMDRFILAYGDYEKYLCSYDLNNLENIERTKDQFEILNGDTSKLVIVRCSGEKVFVYDTNRRLHFI